MTMKSESACRKALDVFVASGMHQTTVNLDKHFNLTPPEEWDGLEAEVKSLDLGAQVRVVRKDGLVRLQRIG